METTEERKGDAVKLLDHTRRTRDVYWRILIKLKPKGSTRAVR